MVDYSIVAGPTDHGIEASAIRRAGDPSDVAITFESINDARHTTGGQRRLSGQIGHAQLPLGRPPEPQQDLELDHREAVLRDLTGETTVQTSKGLAKQTHGRDPGVVEEFGCHDHHYSNS